MHADWSPDGSLVAFDVMDDFGLNGSTGGGSAIYVVDVAGGTPQRIAECEAEPCLQYAYPSWSPDGRKLAMMRYNAYEEDGSCCTSFIVVSDVHRSRTGVVTLRNERVVTSFTDADVENTYDSLYFPRWSPDSRRLVYVVEQYDLEDPYPYLWSRLAVVRVDGRGGPRFITEPQMNAHTPDWSRSGEIVFGTNTSDTAPVSDQPSNLWTVRPDGSHLRQLTHASTDGSLRLLAPRWAGHDCTLLATIARASDGTRIDQVSLAVVSTRTGRVTDLGIAGSRASLQPRG